MPLTSKQIKDLDRIIKQARKDWNIKKFSGGKCDLVAKRVWDLLGRPSDYVLYSVYWGEEEHTVLYNKADDKMIDPTGDQFGNDYLGIRSPRKQFDGYGSFKRLSKKQVDEIPNPGQPA